MDCYQFCGFVNGLFFWSLLTLISLIFCQSERIPAKWRTRRLTRLLRLPDKAYNRRRVFQKVWQLCFRGIVESGQLLMRQWILRKRLRKLMLPSCFCPFFCVHSNSHIESWHVINVFVFPSNTNTPNDLWTWKRKSIHTIKWFLRFRITCRNSLFTPQFPTFMDPLNFAITVISLTASGALAPGPLFFVTITHDAKSGAKSGIRFSITHTIVEFTLIMLLALRTPKRHKRT